ncbi:MAG TPA: hypothetical protein VEO18_04365 [Thermoplasmata archaeon]|nr:hypothetical protein [Thermoplasmata archaeon]
MAANLTLSITANVSVVDPGDTVFLYANARNVGNETATNATFEAPLDINSSYVWSFPTATYDSINRTLRWTLATLAVGGRVDVVWVVRVAVGTTDNTIIDCRWRASYANATGTTLPPGEVVTTVRVRAPVFDPLLRPVPLAAEHADTVVAKLYVNNTGSGTALRAWSNWTLGGNFQFESLEENVTVTNVSDGFQVALSNLPPGPHALTAHLLVLRGLNDGLSMGVQTLWTATDGNGNRLIPISTSDTVTLAAPTLQLAMNASALQVNTSARFVLTVTVRNTGHAAGIGWLNTTVPSGPLFISDNGSFPRTNQGRRYSWMLPSIAPGGSVVLGINFDAAPDAGAGSFVFTLDFTDGTGSPPATVTGPRIDIEFVSPATSPPPPVPADLTPWAAIAAAGGLAAALVVWRRRRASELRVEDVFVADGAGHLLTHRSSGLLAYEDEDILMGMFKVIQDFVHDSFAKGTNDVMKSIEVGDRKIIIERGRYHSLSVVYRGLDRGSLAERIRMLSSLIDERFGPTLVNWSGDLDELRGLAGLLPQLWKYHPRRRPRRWPSPRRDSAIPDSTKIAEAATNESGSEESSAPELVAEPPK